MTESKNFESLPIFHQILKTPQKYPKRTVFALPKIFKINFIKIFFQILIQNRIPHPTILKSSKSVKFSKFYSIFSQKFCTFSKIFGPIFPKFLLNIFSLQKPSQRVPHTHKPIFQKLSDLFWTLFPKVAADFYPCAHILLLSTKNRHFRHNSTNFSPIEFRLVPLILELNSLSNSINFKYFNFPYGFVVIFGHFFDFFQTFSDFHVSTTHPNPNFLLITNLTSIFLFYVGNDITWCQNCYFEPIISNFSRYFWSKLAILDIIFCPLINSTIVIPLSVLEPQRNPATYTIERSIRISQ